MLRRYPAYRNTSVTYFPLGEDKFREMLIQLEKARKFIFLEYFIVHDGEMLDAILDILKRKVKQGVEVRFMYDGMCSLAHLPFMITPRDLIGLRQSSARCSRRSYRYCPRFRTTVIIGRSL